MRKRRKSHTKKSPSIKRKNKKSLDDPNIVILFADIVGCSEISSHKSLKRYDQFLSAFRECFYKVCDNYLNLEYEEFEKPFFIPEVRGDEGCLKICVSRKGNSLAKDIDIAINIAIDLKRLWLFTSFNKEERIDSGFLPIDLGIGIHTGKAYINPEENMYINGKDCKKVRPEGYAINLAKRIESESRKGKFTNIFVSEAARGHLYNLKDEPIYNFDKPYTFSAKGIMKDVKTFEIKHHFFPTDWYDEFAYNSPQQISIIYDILKPTELNNVIRTVEAAYKLNPTNLWIFEEYIIFRMINAHNILKKAGKLEDKRSRRKEYEPLYKLVLQIANSDELRDASLLSICGDIAGEFYDFKKEQKRYKDALKIDKWDGDIYSYLAYSLSSELYEKYNKEKKKKRFSLESFYKSNIKTINCILNNYKRAIELRPMNPWIKYDYACELSWWSQVDNSKRKEAVKMLITAHGDNPYVKDWAEDEDEEYIKPIIDDEQVKQHLFKIV